MSDSKWIRLVELRGQGFRSYVDPFKVVFPERGLTLIAGINRTTGDTSDSGKSTLLLALSHLTGGCPYPATQLRSWHLPESERASGMKVGGTYLTPGGAVVVERGSKLSVKVGSEKPVTGTAGEALLDRVFGMDAALRGAATYVPQGSPGLFLSLSDEDKKRHLAKLIPDLTSYEVVSAAAEEALKALAAGVTAARTAAAVAEGIAGSKETELRAATATAEAKRSAATTDRATAENLFAVHTEILDFNAGIAEREKLLTLGSTNRPVPPQELVAGVGEAMAARTSAEASAITNPEILYGMQQISEAKQVVATLRTADTARLRTYESAKSEIRIRIAAAQSATRLGPGLLLKQTSLVARIAELNQGSCFTCKREWITPDSETALREAEAELEKVRAELADATSAAGSVLTVTNILEQTPPFQTDPEIAIGDAEVAEMEAAVQELRNADAEQKRAALRGLQAEETAARAAVQAWTDAANRDLAEVARKISAEISVSRSEVTRLTAERRRIESGIAGVAAAEVAVKNAAEAHGIACAAANEKCSALIVAETKFNFESDVSVLAGRKGFLGCMVREVLGEVADTANEILAGISNVRSVVFRFDPDPDLKRISPIVVLDGEERPLGSGLSGGMGTAVQRAVDLAFGTVVAKRRAVFGGSYPGWLALDESFNGLGSASKEACLEMLQAHAGDRLVLCIDHASEFTGMFSQVIRTETVDRRSSVL